MTSKSERGNVLIGFTVIYNSIIYEIAYLRGVFGCMALGFPGSASDGDKWHEDS